MNSDRAYSIAQDVNLVVGKTYKLTFSVSENTYCELATYNKTGLVQLSGFPAPSSRTFFHNAAANVSAATWSTFTYTFTATQVYTTITIGSTTAGTCGPSIDNVVLCATNSAASLTPPGAPKVYVSKSNLNTSFRSYIGQFG